MGETISNSLVPKQKAEKEVEAPVEVKKSKTHDRAAIRIQPQQVARIRAAAQLYLQITKRPIETEMRFDAALVDQYGVIKVLPGAF